MSKYYSLVLAALPAARSHSWIDSITCVCNGQQIGETGYARKYPGRDNAEFPIDEVMTNKVQGRQLDAFMVQEQYGQRTPGQMDGLPRLSCPANSEILITYTPNGHVTKDTCIGDDSRCTGGAGGPPPTSYWYIHWNQGFAGRQLEKRQDVNVNTGATSVGNLKNVLPGFTPQSFGDGSCGEAKSGEPCVGRFTIPGSATQGTTQFVWNWVFDRNENGGGEEYFTFFDIEILAPTTTCAVQTSNLRGNTDGTPALTSSSTTPAPTAETTDPPTGSGNTCGEVSEGDAGFGISKVSDTRCPDFVGCLNEGKKCRFCRVSSSEENDKNKHLESC